MNSASASSASITTTASTTASSLRSISIKRFRGIKDLTWRPAPGLNLILGGGDVGKTTILDAIALLLSPTNAVGISDTDYFMRDLGAEFSIEGVFTLPPETGISEQLRPSWPWEWNGTEAVVPSVDGEATTSESVYVLRVRGTSGLELSYEIVQPDGSANLLSVALRRAIGLVRLGGDDRGDRELRLVHGSALDRLLSDKTLRAKFAATLAEADIKGELSADAAKALKDLDAVFAKENLPDGLDLSVIGSPGASVASMIGLTAFLDDRTQLPLSSWGAGTRRLAALAIAEQNECEHPITVVDEIERGLEPYRQRVLIGKLRSRDSQVFITTHSPAAISATSVGALWYLAADGRVGTLADKKIAAHRMRDPDTFLSRLAIIGEGMTEVGFCRALLERALDSPLQRHGIHVSDGNGNSTTLEVLEALAEGGLGFGGFADDEGISPQRWAAVIAANGPLVFRWKAGCIEDNVILAVSNDRLDELVECPKGDRTGERLRTLADRLGIKDKDFHTLKTTAGVGLKQLVIDAAKGAVPDHIEDGDEKKRYKSHGQKWFKNEDGGRELFEKVFSLDLWPALKAELLPFCNAVRQAVGLAPIVDLEP